MAHSTKLSLRMVPRGTRFLPVAQGFGRQRKYWRHIGVLDMPHVEEPKPQAQSFIYFIECAGFVKIGISTRPQKRFVGIRVSNPFDCKMIGTMKGGIEGERRIHEFIKSHHHRGEWYRLTDDLRDLITYLLGPDDAPEPNGWPSVACSCVSVPVGLRRAENAAALEQTDGTLRIVPVRTFWRLQESALESTT